MIYKAVKQQRLAKYKEILRKWREMEKRRKLREWKKARKARTAMFKRAWQRHLAWKKKRRRMAAYIKNRAYKYGIKKGGE